MSVLLPRGLRGCPDAGPSIRPQAEGMCFGAFTALERCERCGRVHPEGLETRCIELAAERQADGLEAELAAYLDSPEARFFSWLGARAAAPADR